ncbi:MAG: hypothetical protein HRT53_10505 [Colwellia sp.]|nr:hypothetical protein [Colwellia sp.]
MNITPQTHTLSIPTAVNPQTDNLRRENNLREVIAKPAAASQSAAEKGVASEKERAKTPAQNNESIDFENIRKQAELETKTINGESDREKDSSEQSAQQQFIDADVDSENEPQSEAALDESPEPNSLEDFAQKKILTELKLRDQEVRTHELAHASVGGATTGAPKYTFEVGPDGKKYAVGGEVSVDLAKIDGNPRATISKMQKVHAAALAPANPSIQDTRVASSAARIILQAQSELAAIRLEDPTRAKESSVLIKPNDVLEKERSKNSNDVDFDTLVNRTLDAQEKIAPSRDIAVDERSLRIEKFYSGINQAYEKEPSSHFQLTA